MLEILTNPDEFFRKHEDVNFLTALLIVFTSAVLGVLIVYANLDIIESEMIRHLQQTISIEKARLVFEMMKYYFIITPFIGAFVGWLIISGLIHIVSSVLGGEGDFSKTLKLTAFGYVPSIVLFPVNFSIVRMTHEFMNPSLMIIGVASTIWQFLILTFAVKNWRKLDTTKAAVSVVVPLVVLTGLSLMGKLLRLR